jgi:hypothetical protein
MDQLYSNETTIKLFLLSEPQDFAILLDTAKGSRRKMAIDSSIQRSTPKSTTFHGLTNGKTRINRDRMSQEMVERED